MTTSKKADADERRLKRLAAELDKRAIDHDVEPDTNAPLSARLEREWKRILKVEKDVQSTKREQEKAAKALETQSETLERKSEEVAEAEESLEAARATLEAERQQHEAALEAHRSRLDELREQRESLRQREDEARAGFEAVEKEVIARHQSERDRLQAEVDELKAQALAAGDEIVADARTEREELLKAARAEAQTILDDAQAEVAALVNADAERVADLERREREALQSLEQARQERELVEVEREIADQRRARVVALVEERVAAELRDVEATLGSVSSERDRLRQRVGELESLVARSGGDPTSLAKTIDELTAQRDALEAELRVRPTAERLAILEAKAAEADRLQEEVSLLKRSAAQSDQQLRRQGLAVAELEVLRDERDSLESEKIRLQQAIREYHATVTELDDLDRAEKPFPECSDIDADRNLQRPAETSASPPLDELVEQIRGSMAAEERYYTALDTQLFLSGLASTHLHILQGHSGTGKTTLPVRFAAAIGGMCEVVEVQAGWRDEDDLFGYYNAFERRFYEKEFTLALYRALTPAYRDRPVFVVMDEMNLSHPEQYFSTVLSRLENPSDDPSIGLVARKLDNAPAAFREGRRLPWPDNVWFVGTANQDETTVAFADKTIDRSHVQELPIKYTEFRAQSFVDDAPISLASLRQRFDEATYEHARQADRVLRCFREDLSPVLNHLDASWSNRVDEQIKSFVPVAIASGASLSDAADHVLRTKILRKVLNRHDLVDEHLTAVLGVVEKAWQALGPGEPTTSVQALEREASRLRGEIDLADVV